MLGQLLGGRYKVVQVLGAGGFGQTFVAEDINRPGNPVCVVKQLKPASSDPGFLETARRMFQSEAETLELLGKKYAQIPQLLASLEQDQEFYLVQEYIEGQTLSAALRPGEKWTENQVIDLLREVLGILVFVHQNGVIHRDVKPDNIIRRRSDNKFVLVDFGAVKQIRTQTTTGQGMMSATIAIGTPGYMPSEQGIGKPKPSSDIYALGIIAVQALTGSNPAPDQEDTDTGFRYNQNTGEIIWQDKVQASPGLAALLTKMVKPHFPDRYASALEALRVLEQLKFGYTPTVQANSQGYTPTVVPTSPDSKDPTVNINNQPETLNQQQQSTRPQYEPNRSSSNKFLLGGATLLSVVIAGGLFYFNPTRSQPQPVVKQEPTTSSPTPVASPSISPFKSIPTVSPSSSSPPPSLNPGTSPDRSEENRRRLAEAEKQRLAEVEKQRLAEAEKQRLAEAEKQRLAEAEKQRLAEAEKQRLAEAAEKQRLAEACSSIYDPKPYRPGTPQWDGHIGKIAFNNGTDRTVKVTLYHPDNPSMPFGSWDIQPGANTLLGDDNYGMDWGIQVDNSNICIVKRVSDFFNDSNGAHFQTWPERLR